MCAVTFEGHAFLIFQRATGWSSGSPALVRTFCSAISVSDPSPETSAR